MSVLSMVSAPQHHHPLVFHPRLHIYSHYRTRTDKNKNAINFHRTNISAMSTVISKKMHIHSKDKDCTATSMEKYARDVIHRMDTRDLDSSHCQELHNLILTSGLQQDVYLGSKLISMYASCGNVEDARQVFDKITHKPSVVLWTAMINAYARNGLHHEALKLYLEMKQHGIYPNGFTFSSVLKACAGLSAAEEGKAIHVDVIKCGFCSYVVVCSALVDMYAKCGKVEDACQVFDKMSQRDVVSWSAIISGFAQNRRAKEAIEYFRSMLHDGIKCDRNMLVIILMVCRRLAALHWGKEIHAQTIKRNLEFDVSVGTALVAMYVQCKKVDAARGVFDRVSQKNLDLWNVMISAYFQHGYANEALKLFSQMYQDSVKPSTLTISRILPSCGHLTSLKQGKEIHSYVIKNRLESNVFVCSALINMYAKCGVIRVARQVFDRKSNRDVISWTAMIEGYGMNGHGKQAIKCFHEMQKGGLKPNSFTFVALLSACSHEGFVSEGWQYFNSMSQKYHIKPRVEHYACMVDLLGRAGRLTEAYHFIQDIPTEPKSGMWEALLVACRIHGNVELGENVARQLFEIDPENARGYTLLTNIYAEAGRWNDVERVRKIMNDRSIQPQLGCSLIEVGNKVRLYMVLIYLSLLQRKSVFVVISLVLLRSYIKLMAVNVI